MIYLCLFKNQISIFHYLLDYLVIMVCSKSPCNPDTQHGVQLTVIMPTVEGWS